jgi:hypothetical protein
MVESFTSVVLQAEDIIKTMDIDMLFEQILELAQFHRLPEAGFAKDTFDLFHRLDGVGRDQHNCDAKFIRLLFDQWAGPRVAGRVEGGG